MPPADHNPDLKLNPNQYNPKLITQPRFKMGKLIERIDVYEHRRMSPSTLSRAARKEVLMEFLRRMGEPIIPEKRKAAIACDVYRVIQDYHGGVQGRKDGHDSAVSMTGMLNAPTDPNRRSVEPGILGNAEQGAVHSNLGLNVHPAIAKEYAPAVNQDPFTGRSMCRSNETASEEQLGLAEIEYHLERELTAELGRGSQAPGATSPETGDQSMTKEVTEASAHGTSFDPSQDIWPAIDSPAVSRKERDSGVGFCFGPEKTQHQSPHFATVEVLQLRHGAITTLLDTTSATSTTNMIGKDYSVIQDGNSLPTLEVQKNIEEEIKNDMAFHRLNSPYHIHHLCGCRPFMDLAKVRTALIFMKRVIGREMFPHTHNELHYDDETVTTADEEALLAQVKLVNVDDAFPAVSFVFDAHGNHIMSEKAHWLVTVILELRQAFRERKKYREEKEGASKEVGVEKFGCAQIVAAAGDAQMLEYEECMRQLVEEVVDRLQVPISTRTEMREVVKAMVFGVLAV
ncbi:uncharacterized protein EI97DRAFT_465393 [Westerdykella ornata]|uniref:Uncharacterized protein n=1 Tax=Westerdykella ornata TaxID=318751 RepID=A0A6A6JT76_WESOR|nr:uncharacterized protein EI97DRAFT_465393 [Westerdykella ornata]KAF2279048.1 hypothetical protein EI97DRAFT_465393 [Westerdykella ornata]